jgi:hypothetical protein
MVVIAEIRRYCGELKMSECGGRRTGLIEIAELLIDVNTACVYLSQSELKRCSKKIGAHLMMADSDFALRAVRERSVQRCADRRHRIRAGLRSLQCRVARLARYAAARVAPVAES